MFFSLFQVYYYIVFFLYHIILYTIFYYNCYRILSNWALKGVLDDKELNMFVILKPDFEDDICSRKNWNRFTIDESIEIPIFFDKYKKDIFNCGKTINFFNKFNDLVSICNIHYYMHKLIFIFNCYLFLFLRMCFYLISFVVLMLLILKKFMKNFLFILSMTQISEL